MVGYTSGYRAKQNRIRRPDEEIMNSVPQNSKTITPWIQAKDRMFNGNSRSVRTAPLKILTPAPRVLVLLNSASKSLKISPAAFRKGASMRLYPAVFCSHPASTVPDNFKFDTKSEDRTFSATINSFPAVLLKTGIYIRFRAAVQATAPCQSIKFCLHFSCLNLKL